MNFFEIIFLFFAGLSLILAVFMFMKKKGDRIANSLLGVYLLLFSLNLVYNVLYWSKLLFHPKYVSLFGALILLWMLYPPLIYFYIRRVTSSQKFKFKDLIHLLPFLLGFLAYHRLLLLDANSKFDALKKGFIGDYIYFGNYTTAAVSLVMLFYLLLIYNFFINRNDLGYNKTLWLKWVIGSFSGYVIAMIVYFVLSHYGLIATEHDYMIMYTIIFFIGIVAYFGIMQPEVFNGLSVSNILPFKKYRKSGLSESLSIEFKDKLVDLMETEKPYLNGGLSLNDLSEQANLSRHHLSQIINEHFDASFYFYINTYRTKEAKRLLENDLDLNINDIIHSSGFNNRVSFYKAFKIHTGTTPTDYRQKFQK